MNRLGHRADRTRSAIGWIIMLAVLATAGFAVYQVFQHETRPREVVMIGTATYAADVAQTDEEREKGLSGRKELPATQAMLFKFPKDDRWGIWMKNMLFSIDVVWLDAQQKVVHIEREIQPDAEPYTTYRPRLPARYVLEIPAGDAAKHGIRTGVVAQFEAKKGLE